MKKLALIVTTLMMSTVALADGTPWPDLKPGDVRVLEKGQPIPDSALKASRFTSVAEVPANVKFTFFKTAHGNDYLIISPCCGPQGAGASLFERVDNLARPVALTVGDPRKGFITQPFADAISVSKDATSLRAQVNFSDCEMGVWGYYYKFDEIDRPSLVSVIDTSCAHLGVRELFHTPASVSHWWQH